jgi:creatinine amidohydrolase
VTERVLLGELTREELADVASSCTVVLPLGATEQHGGHLPVSMDTLMCEHVAVAAARIAGADAGPFLVAPPLPYGRSDHHLSFAGTFSLRSETFLAVLGDLLRSATAWGVRAVFAVNGHGGNDAPMRVALADAAEAWPLTAGGASYWTIAWDALLAEGADRLGVVPGHAGAFETSLLLAARPDLVRPTGHVGLEPRPATEDPIVRIVHAAHGAWGAGSGTSDDASTADAALGARLLSCTEQEVARTLIAFHRRVHDGS